MDGVSELQGFIDDVLPVKGEEEIFKSGLLEVVVDTTEYFNKGDWGEEC